MKLKSVLSCLLVIAVALTSSACAEAKTAVKLNSSKMTVTAGKSKTLKLSGTKKKVGFKITSGSKLVKIKRISDNSVKVTALKKGTAKIKATLGKKSYTCTVTVKASSDTISVKINGKSFKAVLNSSKAAKQFTKMLPLTLEMNELNGNEKYHFFDSAFTGTNKTYSTINAGDLMIYSESCLVLFYDEIKNSPYEYIKIGKLTDVSGLKKACGSGNIKVKFVR